MDEEQKKWNRQYTSNLGAKEFLRLSCAILVWVFIGGTITVALELAGFSAGSIVLGIFFIMLFVFPFIALSWKPGYSLLRKIIGNENIPSEPFPRSTTKPIPEPRTWWSYLPSIWWFLMLLLLLYVILKR